MIKKFFLLQLFWALAVAGSLAFNINSAYQETLVNASVAAQATVNRDISFRSWAAKKGGVYIFPSEETPSNPYLVHPLKDITTKQNLPLTLLNPAYFIRDIQEHASTELGIETHLVSNNPINPKNQADAWEAKALKSFNETPETFTDFLELNGQPYYRSIYPFFVKPECMVCHAHQGYKIGEVRGGITASVLLTPYLASFNLRKNKLLATHFGVWSLGFLGFMAGFFREKKTQKTKQQYLSQLQLAAKVFEKSYDGILITDHESNIVDANEAFERISGYTKDEVIGKNPRFLSSGRQEPSVYQSMWEELGYTGSWQGEIWNKKKNGQFYALNLSINTIYDEKQTQQIKYYLAVGSDITHIKENEAKLKFLAHYDALTGLPNRLLITNRLQEAMKQANKDKTLVAIIYFDLDSFKIINDKYSHEIGDLLLVDLSQSLRRLIKKEYTLGRIGGDEFVLIVTQLENTSSCLPLINKILETVSNKFIINGHVLQTTASLGVSFYPLDKVDAEQLIRHADQAMYTAKQQGKNCYIVFDPLEDRGIRHLSAKAKEVQRALKNNEFELFYQPKINSKTNKLIGAEALIRWNHPTKGLLAPGLFLPEISKHAVMGDISYWVMQTTAKQLNDWVKQGINCPISINMDSNLIQEADFINNLKQIFIDYPAINPKNLEIEVLENIAIEDLKKISKTLFGIKEQGVLISIDDFGTGYSSLSYLKHLPVNTLKIDQSFVRNLLDDPDDLAIVQSIIRIAETFKLQIIAEGVETYELGKKLQELGCDWVQGYGVSHPLPSNEFVKWLNKWESDATWLS